MEALAMGDADMLLFLLYKLRNILISLGIVYLLICGALYFWQERLLFFPRTLPADYRYRFSIPFEEVRIPVEQVTLSAAHFRVEQPKGVVLYLHGNGDVVPALGHLPPFITDHGYDLLLFDYRGYGKSTGSITNEANLLADAEAAYAYLAGLYPEEQIVIYGQSLGTGPAAYLASRHKPRLLILESPYSSVRDMTGRTYPFVPLFLLKYPLRTDLWIPEVRAPVLILHGTADPVIPYESSQTLLPLIRSKHRLVTIEGGGHSNLFGTPQYRKVFQQALE